MCSELYYNSTQSHFFMNQSSVESRVLTVENRFDSPILVHSISLFDEAVPYFKVSLEPQYTFPVLLPVGVQVPLLNVEFTPSPQLTHLSTWFRLLTNMSHFELPLYAYTGHLNLVIVHFLHFYAFSTCLLF